MWIPSVEALNPIKAINEIVLKEKKNEELKKP